MFSKTKKNINEKPNFQMNRPNDLHAPTNDIAAATQFTNAIVAVQRQEGNFEQMFQDQLAIDKTNVLGMKTFQDRLDLLPKGQDQLKVAEIQMAKISSLQILGLWPNAMKDYRNYCVDNAMIGIGYKQLSALVKENDQMKPLFHLLISDQMSKTLFEKFEADIPMEVADEQKAEQYNQIMQAAALQYCVTTFGNKKDNAENIKHYHKMCGPNPLNFKLAMINGTKEWFKMIVDVLTKKGLSGYHEVVFDNMIQPCTGLLNKYQLCEIEQGSCLFGVRMPKKCTAVVPVCTALAFCPEIMPPTELHFAQWTYFLAICSLYVNCYYIDTKTADETGSHFQRFNAALSSACKRNSVLNAMRVTYIKNAQLRSKVLSILIWQKSDQAEMTSAYESTDQLAVEMSRVLSNHANLVKGPGKLKTHVLLQNVAGGEEVCMQNTPADDATIPEAHDDDDKMFVIDVTADNLPDIVIGEDLNVKKCDFALDEYAEDLYDDQFMYSIRGGN